MRIRDSIPFLSLLALVSLPLANAFAQKQSIEVKVLDDIEQPVKDAMVYFVTSDGSLLQGQSDAMGIVRFEFPKPSVVPTARNRDWFWVHHSKFNLLSVVRQSDTQSLHLLNSGPRKQTVVWGEKKVAGAIVRPIEFESEPIPVPLQEKLQATTNADGQVELAGFPGDSSGLVEVRAKGLGVQTMQARGRPLLGIKTAPVGILQLRGVGTVRGRVIADAPELLKGLKLQFESKDKDGVHGGSVGRFEVAEFTPDGSFEIPEYTSGQIEFFESRSEPVPYQIRRPSPDTLQLTPGGVCKLNLTLERLVTVVGEVRFEDGTPVVDAYLLPAVLQPLGRVKTDALGRYQLQMLPGDWESRVFRIESLEERDENGARRKVKWEQKIQPELENLEIPKTTDEFKVPTITILKQRTVKGKLVDKDDKPLPNETVFACRTLASGYQRVLTSALSDAEGAFELQLCAATDSYEYLHDHEKRKVVQNRAAKPMEQPSSDRHEAVLVKDGDSIVLQSK